MEEPPHTGSGLPSTTVSFGMRTSQPEENRIIEAGAETFLWCFQVWHLLTENRTLLFL
jgi:hypothetical protein